MEVFACSQKLNKLLHDERALKKKYGQKIADKIIQRLDVLQKAENLAEVSTLPPPRLHQLQGARKDEFAVNLTEKYRLVFLAFDMQDELTLDKDKAVSIEIQEVVDYH